MRKRYVTAFAIIASILVATTLPIGGAATIDGLVVGSQHTTDSDFNNAQTLDNMTVKGSGASATVELASLLDEGTTATRPSDDAASEETSRDGVEINPNLDLDAIEVEISANVAGASKVYVTATNGTVLDSADISGGGDVVRLTASLTAGTDYYVVVDDGGNSYTRGYYSNPSWPYSSGDVDITQAVFDDTSTTTANAYNIKSVTALQSANAEEGSYVSADHEVTNAEQANVNLSLTNASATVTVQEYTGSDWQDVASAEYTTSANHTLDISSASYDTLRTEITFSNQSQNGNPNVILYDESILFANQAPSIDDASATPSGGKKIQSKTVDLSINATDQEFGTAQGENVTVTFYDASDDSVIGSYTLSSNRTATTEWSNIAGGTNQWYAIAEDEYGGEVQSGTFSFEVPGTLYIRNETDTDQLVGNSIETTVTFFGSGQVYERTTSDGTINLTGLPVNEDFIVDVDPSSGYHGRTIYIQSVYDQQNVYLLSTNEASIESRFVLEDPTGQYDSETFFLLEKPINQSGTVSYQTIVSDQFGSEGVTTTLGEGARYRIRVRSTSGTTQEIGPYRADVGETVTVRPGSPTIELGELKDGWAANATIRNDTIEYVYSDPDGLTDSVTVTAYEKGNESNTLDSPREYYDLGDLSGTYSLTKNQTDKTWVVKFDVDRDGGQYTVTEEVSNRPDLVPGLSDAWRLVIGIGIMLISAGVFSVLNASVGGVVVALEGGILWWTGWLGGATTAAAVVIALFVAVTVHIYTSGGP